MIWPEFAVCGQRVEMVKEIQGVAGSAAKACAYVCPGLRREEMLDGVGLVLDNHRLFSLAGSQALALIEDEIGLAQPSDGARS